MGIVPAGTLSVPASLGRGGIFLLRIGGGEGLQEEEKSLEGFHVRPRSERQKYDKQLQGGKLNGFEEVLRSMERKFFFFFLLLIMCLVYLG